uniref:CAP10 domain-containing protein n=1 Tax=Gongylonema pulchrum TaxID=637853 RepID=A0A183E1K3_9BILA
LVPSYRRSSAVFVFYSFTTKREQSITVYFQSHAHLHLKVGHSSAEALYVAASSKNEFLKTPLPYILPYLKAHDKQAYLVKRCRDLAADLCMKNYHWQGGGSEPVERKDVIFRMGANPLVSDIAAPFSSVFYLKKPARPSKLQCTKKSYYVYQSSVHPPHFELVLDGGRERFEVDRGAKNLWRTILLFIQHIRLFNNCQLGNIRIDRVGVNLACVLE